MDSACHQQNGISGFRIPDTVAVAQGAYFLGMGGAGRALDENQLLDGPNLPRWFALSLFSAGGAVPEGCCGSLILKAPNHPRVLLGATAVPVPPMSPPHTFAARAWWQAGARADRKSVV